MQNIFDINKMVVEKKTRIKLNKIMNYFSSKKSALVSFSGGIDSSFLLILIKIAMGNKKVIAYTSFSSSISKKEQLLTQDFCNNYGILHIVDSYEETDDINYVKNQLNRCYFCKNMLYSRIHEYAKRNEIDFVSDGTNYDDLSTHRPGLNAAREYGVETPLADFKFLKVEIRKISKILGLKNWNKPEQACLASRVPHGTKVTKNKLNMIEKSEKVLHELGILHVRVRYHDKLARIQVYQSDFNKIIQNREKIIEELKKIGFEYVALDIAEPSQPKK